MKKLNKKIEIIDVLEQWAKYCSHRDDGGLGWPKKTILGKARDALPTNLCPVCIGKAKPVHNCPVCGGDGRVKLDVRDNRAIPAFIRGNGYRATYDDDPQSQRVDLIICTELSEIQKSVVILVYCRYGTYAQKAGKVKKSDTEFSKILSEAHEIIERHLW